MSAPLPPSAGPNRARIRATGLMVLSIFVLMVGMAYAAVPFYRAFCRATGYGGTTQVAIAGPKAKGTRIINIRFDANVAPGLAWRFEPETPEIQLRTGTTATVYFKVHNDSDRPTAANALYNITPDIGGFYFNKISCFCFDEQHLGPNETAELPVVFFVDPDLDKDPNMKSVDTMTLSYTFFAVKARPAVSADANKGEAAPKL